MVRQAVPGTKQAFGVDAVKNSSCFGYPVNQRKDSCDTYYALFKSARACLARCPSTEKSPEKCPNSRDKVDPGLTV